MAFQNNSGDIILDVVLTDEGRRRLAQGDGTFEITQFALGDDEINYELFDTSSTTALQDLSILQTPILEAFTNNTSLMKSKLLSLEDDNLLYLPILRLNTLQQGARLTAQNNFVVCVDQTTQDDGTSTTQRSIGVDANGPRDGMIFGVDTSGNGSRILVDSGIDSTNVSDIDPSLIENSFMVEIDNRLGSIISSDGQTRPSLSKLDDDHVATYIFNINNTNTSMSKFISNVDQGDFLNVDSPIDGRIAARLEFKIRSSTDLRVSNFLFDRIGSSDTTTYKKKDGVTNASVKIIDSIVRVSGMNTGYSLDIPVRFAKAT